MEVTVMAEQARLVTVVITGMVNVFTVDRLRQALIPVIATGTRDVVVDCAKVESMDATGLGVLVGAWRRARRAGIRLEIARPTPALRSLLAETRLDAVLPVTGGVHDWRRSPARPPANVVRPIA